MISMMLVGLAWSQEGTPSFKIPPPEEPMLNRDIGGFGLGLLLGLPTGLSAAWRPAEGRVYYDGALAWGFDGGMLHIHGDVLLILADLRTDEIEDVHFPVYLGLGPRIRLEDKSRNEYQQEVSRLGVRVPIGMSFVHDGVPLEAFLELAPGIGLFPAIDGTFDVAIGARYYFPSSRGLVP